MVGKRHIREVRAFRIGVPLVQFWTPAIAQDVVCCHQPVDVCRVNDLVKIAGAQPKHHDAGSGLNRRTVRMQGGKVDLGAKRFG
jgi:hypothetical protein